MNALHLLLFHQHFCDLDLLVWPLCSSFHSSIEKILMTVTSQTQKRTIERRLIGKKILFWRFILDYFEISVQLVLLMDTCSQHSLLRKHLFMDEHMESIIENHSCAQRRQRPAFHGGLSPSRHISITAFASMAEEGLVGKTRRVRIQWSLLWSFFLQSTI